MARCWSGGGGAAQERAASQVAVAWPHGREIRGEIRAHVLPSDSRGFILPPHTRSSDGGGSSSMVGPPHGGGALSTDVTVNPKMTMVGVACPRVASVMVACLRAAQQRQQHSRK